MPLNRSSEEDVCHGGVVSRDWPCPLVL
jgi:hypothetical protein